MRQKTLAELTASTRRYLDTEHPELSLSNEEIGTKLTLLYEQINDELSGVDAQLIRHKVVSDLGELDLTLEIEKIGLFSGFCLHIEQDDGMIAQWVERGIVFD